MFSRWIVTNITSARGTVHCRKTRISCGDRLVICGLYPVGAAVQTSGTSWPGLEADFTFIYRRG
jgi:hypothetical protein